MNTELWRPSKEQIETSSMMRFIKFVNLKFNQEIENYQELHQFSVQKATDFWSCLFEFFEINYSGSLTPACESLDFENYTWFENVEVNFTQNLLAKGKDDHIALNFVHESGLKSQLSYTQLREKVAQFQSGLKSHLKQGEVLACYMPHIPETVMAMLATSALGGVFTSTSCDFGVEGVVDRFSQSKPKVLVACTGYEYNGKYFDLRENIKEITSKVKSIKKVILVDFLGKNPSIQGITKASSWNDFCDFDHEKIEYVKTKFSDPLYIMYSSGTTGKPKCIVHSVGGTLLQHIKELGLHTNLDSEDNIFYFTTCGWMMWNWLVSSLYFGSQITMYEGSPGKPTVKDFFKIIDNEKINIFGTSPKFLRALQDSGYDKDYSLSSLKTLLSTGAPLLPEQYDYVYKNIKSNIQLSSISGGTDIIGCFMLGCPIMPVLKGQIQCLGLGMDVDCFDDDGKSLLGKEGELVCKKSFPSRPLHFLNDNEGELMKSAYFEKFPGVWHHGDFISVTEDGSVIVYGRSDATLNPGGVRIGTSEIYRQTESIEEIEDSLCVGKSVDGDVEVLLYVQLKENCQLSEELIKKIKTSIRSKTTPRHVPSKVIPVSGIPYTRSGKKMELLVTKLINGKEIKNLEAVANPESLSNFT